MRTCMSLIVWTALAVSCGAAHAEDADALYNEGVTNLKLANNGDASKVVPAARAFAKASILYERVKNYEAAIKANSCLYWCKKGMTLADAEAFAKGEAALAEKMRQVQISPPKHKALSYLRSAKKFAADYPDERLLIAVRFYEVADRFVGTSVSLEAQRLSLDAMQKIRPATPQAPAPAGKQLAAPAPEGGLADLPRVRSARATFDKNAKKACDDYTKNLDRLIKLASRKGSLSIATTLQAERDAIDPADPDFSDCEDKNVTRYRDQYNKRLQYAVALFIKALELAAKSELRKGNLVTAQQLGAQRDALVIRGRWEQIGAKRRFVWTVKKDGTMWVRGYDGTLHPGTCSVTADGIFLTRHNGVPQKCTLTQNKYLKSSKLSFKKLYY